MDFLQVRDYTPFNKWEQECISHLKNVIMTEEDTYTLLRIKSQKTLTDTVNEADRVRFEWLKEHPYGVYIDPDCKLNERFIPPKNGMCYLPLHSAGHADIFLIYVNGDTEFIKKNFDWEKRNEYIKRYKGLLQKKFYGWPQLLAENMTGFGIIPEYIYNHKNLSIKKEVERRQVMQDQNNLSVGEVVSSIDKKLHEVKGGVYLLEKAMKDLYNEANELKKESGNIVTKSTNTDIENENLRQRIKELEEQLESK